MDCLTFDRECRQQHNPCGDLSEDHRDFDGELNRSAQTVGLQTAKQLTITDSVLVRALKNAFLKVFCFLLPVYFNYKQVWWVGFCSSRSGDRVPLHCVDRHPNQQHIVATGGQDGMLCVWDVRQGNTPFSLMEAHTAESKVGLLWEDVLKLKFKRCCACK